MDKELQETLAQVAMYSKMGRYISNKILKYNKHAKTQRSLRSSPPNREDYLRIKKTKHDSQLQHSASTRNATMHLTQPPVGYYKVNFNQVQKNPRLYDFNRSVPHFNRQRFFCHQAKPVLTNYPDSVICQHRVKGLAQLRRMAGRADIKGSIRKQIEDPHENRFKLTKDFNSIEFGRSRVNMNKDLPRDDAAFTGSSEVPEYDYDYKLPQKRLDTHIIPFERILDRNSGFMTNEAGISNYFHQHQARKAQNLTSWKKMLPRDKVGLLPSYMDKNINTRSSISLLNMKTLEMNCSKLKEPLENAKRKLKKPVALIEEVVEKNKQNIMY